MGNCCVLCKPRISSYNGAVAAKQEKSLQVVKIDGKVSEFSSPPILKHQLPHNFDELKIGRIYCILPPLSSVGSGTDANPAGMSSVAVKEQQNVGSGTKRIKVVITKQQLRELLKKPVSAEDVLSGLQKRSSCAVDCAANWKPKLESIPEGSE